MSRSIAVFCSSSNGAPSRYVTIAAELGKAIARRSHELVWGGSDIGLMGAVARAAQANGGRVHGVIPEAIRDSSFVFRDADELSVTPDLRARKAKMEACSDGFIALPGGFGTLEEVLEIITLRHLDILHKPVVLLNIDGFFDGLLEQFRKGIEDSLIRAEYRGLYFVTTSPEQAVDYIERFEASDAITPEDRWFIDTKLAASETPGGDRHDVLSARLMEFRRARGWDVIEPQDYAKSLAIEVGELLEHFQWDASFEDFRGRKDIEEIASELADIFSYMTYLAHDLGVDLFEVTHRKCAHNEQKYPVSEIDPDDKLAGYTARRAEYRRRAARREREDE